MIRRIVKMASLWFPAAGYHVLRVLLSLLLLFAAALKGHQLATEPDYGTGLLDSRWLLIGVVEFELLFGLWLLANVLPKPTWAAALVCFTAFMGVSLYKAGAGYEACGCFGRAKVSPWYTAGLDLGIVLSLLYSRPRRRWLREGHFGRCRVVAATWLAIGLPAAVIMSFPRVATLGNVADALDTGRVVVLEPEAWIGNPFPLLRYIDAKEPLRNGNWLVLLYRRGCPSCESVLSQCAELTRAAATDTLRRGSRLWRSRPTRRTTAPSASWPKRASWAASAMRMSGRWRHR